MPDARWWVILHGGARDIAPEAREVNRSGCLAALAAGQRVLEAGGSALEAVEASVRTLEDDPTFNAGCGSVLNAGGEVELDAALMDGATLALGGVGAAQGLCHPVSVARAVLGETPTLLVGEGGRQFGQERGCAPGDLISPAQRARVSSGHGGLGHDTFGHIAAGTSTGGLAGARRGRVGDSALPGRGLSADDAVGGVSLSGHGESTSRLMLAARIMQGPETAETADLRTVLDGALAHPRQVGQGAGAIAIDARGRVGWAHRSPQFVVAYGTSEQPAQVYLHQDQETA